MSSRIKTNVKHIYEFWCEVKRPICGGNRSSAAAPAAVIVDRYPDTFCDEKLIRQIPGFAYPCEFENDRTLIYSFTMTGDDSKWVFGFCHHDPEEETVMVMLTYLPWHDTFLKLMYILSDVRRKSCEDFDTFLVETHKSCIPEPGNTLKFPFMKWRRNFLFVNPPLFKMPSIPDNHNLSLFYECAPTECMIAIFAAILFERRIIMSSRNVDSHSSCVQAAAAVIYPLTWQHMLIPVLPEKLKTYLNAPTPYIIGIPQMVFEKICADDLGAYLLFNCDNHKIENPFKDVAKIPKKVIIKLKNELSRPAAKNGENVSRYFLRAMVKLIGSYRDGIEFRDKGVTFNRNKFIAAQPLEHRHFLTDFTEQKMFQVFIEDRMRKILSAQPFHDEFEADIVHYAEKKKNKNGCSKLCARKKIKYPDTDMGRERTMLQTHIFSALQLSEFITAKLKRLIKSNMYKKPKTNLHMRELFNRLNFIINSAVGGFQALQNRYLVDMQQFGYVEAEKQKNCDKQAVCYEEIPCPP